MIVKKNSEALERKAFLIKSLENENITKKEYDAEIAILDPFIKKNLEEALAKCNAELKSKINNVKESVREDGPLKRSVANILINFLEDHFIDDEIKGIFRQGYKIMRSK